MNKLIFFLWVYAIGCSHSYQTLRLSAENPTSYIFSASVDEIRRIAKEKLDFNYRKMSVRFIDHDEMPDLRLDSLKKTEYRNDILLYSHGFSESYLYRNNEKGLRYKVAFHVHLIPINDSTTAVEVRTLHPWIYVDDTWIGKLINHAPGYAITKEVSPSTIEEYEILLQIGEGLGVKDQMPPIVYPDTASIK